MSVNLQQSEFGVLRQTIARRGTARMVLVPVTFIAWAGLSLIVLLFADVPVAALFTLVLYWRPALNPFTRYTSARSGSADSCRFTTRARPTAHAGKPR